MRRCRSAWGAVARARPPRVFTDVVSLLLGLALRSGWLTRCRANVLSAARPVADAKGLVLWFCNRLQIGGETELEALALVAPETAVRGRSTLIRHLPIQSLQPSPGNPRSELGDLTELSASIASVGILQPLLVCLAEDGTFDIICGERRWSAAAAAGLDEVPCMIEDLDASERQLIMLIENLQRSSLSKLDEARAFKRLLDLGFSQRDISARVGKSTAHICRRLKLLSLPPDVQEMVAEQRMAVDTALGYKERDQPLYETDEQLHRAWIALRQRVIDVGDRELAHCLRSFALAHAAWIRNRKRSAGRPPELRRAVS